MRQKANAKILLVLSVIIIFSSCSSNVNPPSSNVNLQTVSQASMTSELQSEIDAANSTQIQSSATTAESTALAPPTDTGSYDYNSQPDVEQKTNSILLSAKSIMQTELKTLLTQHDFWVVIQKESDTDHYHFEENGTMKSNLGSIPRKSESYNWLIENNILKLENSSQNTVHEYTCKKSQYENDTYLVLTPIENGPDVFLGYGDFPK